MGQLWIYQGFKRIIIQKFNVHMYKNFVKLHLKKKKKNFVKLCI